MNKASSTQALALGTNVVALRPAPARLFMLDDVTVQLGGTLALQHVHLQIDAGERVALVGANGSGKSTLLRTLNGLVRPASGQVQSPPQQSQAMLFQRPHMLRLSAQHNVALALWLKGMPWRDARAAALLALARVDLLDTAHRSARRLSGGQQQRLALARAWATRPQVMLLDEPTASLDPHAKREVEQLMDEFARGAAHADGGPATAPMTLIFASHHLGQVKRLASRVLYLEHGRLLVDLPVRDFFDRALLERLSPQAHAFLAGELV